MTQELHQEGRKQMRSLGMGKGPERLTVAYPLALKVLRTPGQPTAVSLQ